MSLASETYIYMTLTDTKIAMGAISISMYHRNTETDLIYTTDYTHDLYLGEGMIRKCLSFLSDMLNIVLLHMWDPHF